MSSGTITRKQLSEGGGYKPYPVGNYTIEIRECEHHQGTSKETRKPWEKVVIRCEIVEPDDFAGKPFTTGLFYDARLADVITVGLGKSLDDVFGKSDTIDRSKLFGILKGQFIKVRLGIDKNGYNQIAEVLESDASESV